MATEVAKVVAKLEADIRDFERGMKKAEGRLDKLEGSTKKANKGFGGLLKQAKKMALVFGVGLGLREAVKFIGSAIKAASDLEESINAAEVVFGSASATIKAFGTVAATQAGLANSAFLQMAANTGQLLQGFGLDVQESADLTIKLTKRAADMASVMNTSVADALGAVQSALRGEAEPIRRFIGSFSLAEVKAFALEKGLIQVGDALEGEAKALASVEFIMDKTNKLSGDFLNTSESLANAQRVLEAQTEDLKAAIGKGLAPAMIVALRFGGRLVNATNKLLAVFDPLVRAAFDLNAVMSILNQQMQRGDAIAFTYSNALKELADRGLLVGANIDLVASATSAGLDVQQDAIAGALGQARATGASAASISVLERSLLKVLRAQKRSDAELDAAIGAYKLGAVATDVFTKEQEALAETFLLLQRNQGEALIGNEELTDAYRNSAEGASEAGFKIKEALKFEEATRQAAEDFKAWEDEVTQAGIDAEKNLRASMGQIVSLFDKAPKQIRTSAERMARNIAGQARVAAKFMDNIAILTAAGLDALVAELEKKGPEAADAAARLVNDVESALAIELDLQQIFGGFSIPPDVAARFIQIFGAIGADAAGRFLANFTSRLGGGVPSGAFTPPNLPRPSIGTRPVPFAAGGIATGPTNALLGEAGVKEAAVPLDGRGIGVLEEAFRRAGTGGGDTFVTVEQSITVADDATAARRILEETRTQLDSLATERF